MTSADWVNRSIARQIANASLCHLFLYILSFLCAGGWSWQGETSFSALPSPIRLARRKIESEILVRCWPFAVISKRETRNQQTPFTTRKKSVHYLLEDSILVLIAFRHCLVSTIIGSRISRRGKSKLTIWNCELNDVFWYKGRWKI